MYLISCIIISESIHFSILPKSIGSAEKRTGVWTRHKAMKPIIKKNANIRPIRIPLRAFGVRY